MSIVQAPVSDMLVTVKNREVQRAMFAEARNDQKSASRHFLAAAHLEFVLVDDYLQAGQLDLADRSRISAASCLWRGGHREQARGVFEEMLDEDPSRQEEIQGLITELEQMAD